MDLRNFPFVKMNGLGNDFVMIDARAESVGPSATAAGAIANRKSGVGCDQVIVLEPSRTADVFMRILNADGSEAGACGNASRCVAAMLQAGLGRNRMSIETRAGTLYARISEDGRVTVDMGAPRFAWDEIPLAQAAADTRAIDLTFTLPDGRMLAEPSTVNVGNPHCIFWVRDAEGYDLAAFGAELEHHWLFPERANISLAEVVDDRTIKLRVWERGAGMTRACGTAACAAAVCAARTGRTDRKVAIQLPGGVLEIEWRVDDDHILMTGPAEFEFAGIVRLSGSWTTVEVTRYS